MCSKSARSVYTVSSRTARVIKTDLVSERKKTLKADSLAIEIHPDEQNLKIAYGDRAPLSQGVSRVRQAKRALAGLEPDPCDFRVGLCQQSSLTPESSTAPFTEGNALG